VKVLNDGVPSEVVDRQLFREAQDLLTWHTADGHGACRGCGGPWPCTCRRLAERAEGAAFGSWNKAWTARHDLNSVRAMPFARNTGSFTRKEPPRTSHPR
jgi:hypothetical protein